MQWVSDSTKRLDAFLAEQSPELSRARLQKLIESGSVTVNDQKVTKQAHKLKLGDRVVLTATEKQTKVDERIEPTDLHLPVLYEDDFCLVINKPAGVAVHPGVGMEDAEVTLLSGIAFLFQERKIPFSADAVLVHRLDKDTTGCVLIAKTADAHAALQKQFEERTVQKKYLAIVFGIPNPPSALIDAPVGRNLTDRTKMSVLRTSTSREARTTYTTLSTNQYAALLACDLHTGRTHQIRVHLRSVGHPILGDENYFTSKSVEYAKNEGIESLCLHAWKLSFTSLSKKKVDLVCEPPHAFTDALQKLSLSVD